MVGSRQDRNILLLRVQKNRGKRRRTSTQASAVEKREPTRAKRRREMQAEEGEFLDEMQPSRTVFGSPMSAAETIRSIDSSYEVDYIVMAM